MKKILYDVLTRKDNQYHSSYFTVDDFLKILKFGLMSYSDFLKECTTQIQNDTDRTYLIKNIFSFHNASLFPNERAKMIYPIIDNEHKLIYSNLFQYKILNFEHNQKPMFDYYINKESGLHVNVEDEDEGFVVHENPNVEPGTLIIRVNNYRRKYGNAIVDYVDVNTNINVHYGLFDAQMRAIPWFVDEWVNAHELKVAKDEVYLMSPLLHHCLKIYDKMLLLSKQKQSYVYPRLLDNAVKASFNDARVIKDMNKRYQFINGSFIRIVPTLIKTTQDGTQYEVSRFFNFVKQQDRRNAFSYSDVVSGGSGVVGTNKISVDDYEKAVFSLGLKDIAFTKEENTTAGLYSWINPDFSKILGNYDNLYKRADLSILSDHMITVDYDKQQYVTAIKGDKKLFLMPDKERKAFVKKYNQRLKHKNSKTYLYDPNDSYNQGMITKEINETDYYFHRNVDYMSNTKELGDETNYARNALVAFVSNEVDLPPVNELVNYSLEDLNKWFYSLRGIACEGFFNKQFLKQRMLVKRTKRLKFASEDASPEFQMMLQDRSSYVGKTYDFNKDRDKFVARTYMDCVCGGKIINNRCRLCHNPRPDSGEVIEEKWVHLDKDFDFVRIDGFRVVEDGINVYLEYSIPLANSRFKCEELTKSVPVETAQADLGYIKDLRLGDFELENVNVPLDGVYFGLGGFKSGVHGIPFTLLRAYNALKGKISYSSKDCVDQTESVQEFLDTFKPSTIVTKMYDKETGTYKNKRIQAWVGMVALSPTEVSQEFNRSRMEDERTFGKTNYALNNLLGFDRLNSALSNESSYVHNQNTDLRDEYFRIANIHSSVRPSHPETKRGIALAIKHDEMVKGISNLTQAFMQQDAMFNVAAFNKYSLRDYITFTEYQYVLDNYPLFTNPKFEQGFIINCSLGLSKDQAIHYSSIGTVEHTIYFPPRKFLLSMFEVIGDNNVRMNAVLSAYISVFETLAVSKLGNARGSQDMSNIHLINKTDSNRRRYFNQVNGKILTAVNDVLFNKRGLLNQITNISVPRVMSKQLTSIECPYDVAIVGSKKSYKEVAERYFKLRYPDRDLDWTLEYNEDRSYKKIGWCWTEDMYCISVREPNLFSKQNLNAKQMWSSVRADLEYEKRIGKTFRQKHPGSKGIYLNPVFVAFNLEGDVDGDTIFLAVPYTIEAQDAVKDVYNQIKDMSFFDADNPDQRAQLVRKTYLVPSLKYLLDEGESLNFRLDVPKIGYCEIEFRDSVMANFEASKNKENIGFLTVSLWYITYFIDFYMYNYDRFIERGYSIPVLTEDDKYDLLFIFQYLLAQQNGVRAMKDDGSYGKITVDALITNKEFEESQSRARQLLDRLIDEYKEENAELGIEIDFAPALNKLYMIFDNFFVSHDKFKGFGYMMDIKGNIFSFKDSKWSYGNKKPKGDEIIYDCTNRYDKFFVDFHAAFLLINGRNPNTFISKFGYDSTLRALEFKNKQHLHSPLLSFAKDVFTK